MHLLCHGVLELRRGRCARPDQGREGGQRVVHRSHVQVPQQLPQHRAHVPRLSCHPRLCQQELLPRNKDKVQVKKGSR